MYVSTFLTWFQWIRCNRSPGNEIFRNCVFREICAVKPVPYVKEKWSSPYSLPSKWSSPYSLPTKWSSPYSLPTKWSSPYSLPSKHRGGVEVQLYSLTSALEGGVKATPRPLYPRERPGTHCIWSSVGPRAGLGGCEKSRHHRYLIAGP